MSVVLLYLMAALSVLALMLGRGFCVADMESPILRRLTVTLLAPATLVAFIWLGLLDWINGYPHVNPLKTWWSDTESAWNGQ